MLINELGRLASIMHQALLTLSISVSAALWKIKVQTSSYLTLTAEYILPAIRRSLKGHRDTGQN